MITTTIITFRESLEALVVIGVLYGFNRKFKLNKESFIIKGALSGFLTGVILVLGLLYMMFRQRLAMPEDQFELLEQILLIFSGVFLIFVTLVIHPFIAKQKNKHINSVMEKEDLSGFSLGTLSFFLVLLEAVETILFISSSSFTSSFIDNVWGLLIGFGLSIVTTILIYKTYLKVHMQKLFKITEYVLFAYGFYLIVKGGSELYHIAFR